MDPFRIYHPWGKCYVSFTDFDSTDTLTDKVRTKYALFSFFCSVCEHITHPVLSMFKLLPRSEVWLSALLLPPPLPVSIPSRAEWIAPITILTSPLNFIAGQCPVTEANTKEWTEEQRERAEAAYAPASLEELDAKVRKQFS